MNVDCDTPQIIQLRREVENQFGRHPDQHNDFVTLSDSIFNKLKEHISETTLERIWNYSTRGYSSVSVRSLNVLASYCGKGSWTNFCEELKKVDSPESDMFDEYSVSTSELEPEDRIRIGWLPDRICVIRFLGENKFVAEECLNSTMQPGDRFSCMLFQMHKPAFLHDYQSATGKVSHKQYGIGLQNGLTMLKKL